MQFVAWLLNGGPGTRSKLANPINNIGAGSGFFFLFWLTKKLTESKMSRGKVPGAVIREISLIKGSTVD